MPEETSYNTMMGFLCRPGIGSQVADLVGRYNEISIEENRLPVAPGEPRLLDRLIWPLRDAKASYVVGNYLGAIALCGMVGEMAAVLAFDMHNEATDPVRYDVKQQSELFGRAFEKLGQDRRINVLTSLGVISEETRDLFESVRTRRNRYLHDWSKDHGAITDDAIACYDACLDFVAAVQHLKGRAAANDTAPRPRRSWTRPAAAIAACALLAIGAGVWFSRAPSRFAPSQHYATAPAEVRTINLADGSTVTLSGAGEASIAISDSERRVELTRGYALFDVAHDPERPFVVHTPEGDITVLGTSFVVRISEGEVRTTVLRGSVSGAADRGLFSQTSASVTAAINEEIVLSDGNAELVAISAETIPRRLAWRAHMLAFDGETLNEAIAQVSEQTGWHFELEDPALGEMRVGGYVHADPEAFIELMSSSLNLEARRKGDRRVMLSRRS